MFKINIIRESLILSDISLLLGLSLGLEPFGIQTGEVGQVVFVFSYGVVLPLFLLLNSFYALPILS